MSKPRKKKAGLNAMHLRAARERARAAGKCTMCRQGPAKAKPDGTLMSTCQACLDEVKATREMNSNAGLCACGNERAESNAKGEFVRLKSCETCSERKAKRMRRARRTKKERGLCMHNACDNAARENRVMCEVHKGTRAKGGV